MFRFFIDCIARSIAPFPLCIRGEHHSISMFQFSQQLLYSFDMNAPPPALSDLISSGIPSKLMLFVEKLVTSCFLEVLHICAVGHLLNRSIGINNCTSPFKFPICKLPLKSVCSYCPCSGIGSRFFWNLVFRILACCKAGCTVLDLLIDIFPKFRPPKGFRLGYPLGTSGMVKV